jgi:hypothetical protein
MKSPAFISQFQEFSNGGTSNAMKTLTETRETNDQFPDNIELRCKRHQIKGAKPTNLCFLQIFQEISSQSRCLPKASTGTETRSRENQDQLFAILKPAAKTPMATNEEDDRDFNTFFAIPRN